MPGLGFWSISGKRLEENKQKIETFLEFRCVSPLIAALAIQMSCTLERLTALRFTSMHIYYIPDCIFFCVNLQRNVCTVQWTHEQQQWLYGPDRKKKTEFTNEEIWNYFYFRFVSVLGSRTVMSDARVCVCVGMAACLVGHSHSSEHTTQHSLTQCTYA